MQHHHLPLARLLYVSTASAEVCMEDVRRIVDRAQVRNRQHDVTGMLVFHPPYFVQVLEGRPAALDTVMAHVRRDVHHHSIRLIERVDIERRRFDRWGMVLLCPSVLAVDLAAMENGGRVEPGELLSAMESEARSL